MIALMKTLIVVLLIAVSVQAQSLAEAARKERERQSKLRPTRVITSVGPSTKTEEPKPKAAAPTTKEAAAEPSKEVSKPQTPAPVDPVQVWNSQVEQLRVKVRGLQDQELALRLQENQATNQVYAPVTDPASQERALAQLGQIQQQLAAVRKQLEDAVKALDGLLRQGPPKK
jgi:hypothetical protein